MRKRLASALFIFTVISFPSGAEKNEAVTTAERETRAVAHEKMAEAHKKMAECLRSDRAFKECHDAFIESCPVNQDGGACPMMEGHRKGRGRQGRGMAPAQEPK